VVYQHQYHVLRSVLSPLVTPPVTLKGPTRHGMVEGIRPSLAFLRFGFMMHRSLLFPAAAVDTGDVSRQTF
jgi:hypothetical protein